MQSPTRRTLVGALIAVPLLGAAACSGSGSEGGDQGGKSLVVDTSFDLKTSDPARSFEFTGTLLDKSLYQTALQFDNGRTPKPVPELASYTMSDHNKVLTLKMRKGATFSDGSPVTADDVVFSYQRVQGIKGNPSFLLDGVTVKKVDDSTITLTSEQPNPQLPAILPNPSLGIVNADVVKKHGGTTDAKDKADTFLDGTSAGSGPYMLESYDPASRVVLKANPHWGGDKPAYSRVVVRNVAAATQKVNIESGDSQLAMDLSPDQIASLDTSRVNHTTAPSTDTIYLFLNQNPSVNTFTSDPDFVAGVKQAIDYDAVVKQAGKGAERLAGVVPTVFLGALPQSQGITSDPAAARQKIKASGYRGESIPFYFPNDMTVGGVPLQPIAEKVQAQLKKVGVTITLKPGPSATAIDAYRAGKDAMGMWYWGSDYPDPSDYLVFTPEENVGVRAQWKKGSSPQVDALVRQAKAAVSPEDRDRAYQALQVGLNKYGPFIPLFAPASNVVTATSVKSVVLNPASTFAFADVK